MKYFIYCRKSTEGEENQVLSIPAQKSEMIPFAEKANLEVVELLEESKTASKTGRPVFNKMLDRIEKGEADGILVWQPNRIARNSMDGGRVIYMMDEGKIKEIRSPFRTYINTSEDKFFLALEFNMAKKDTDDISRNVKRGYREKVRRGEYPSKAPYGYVNVDYGKDSRNIAPHPTEGAIIRKIFEEASTGNYTGKELADLTYDMGILSRKKGKKLCLSTIYRILHDPAYYGYFYFNEELHYNQGTYEPLISKPLFDLVQDKMGFAEAKPKSSNKDFINYLGIMRCPDCGCAITASIKKGHIYYHCTQRKGRCSNNKYLREEDLEKQIEDYIAPLSNAIDDDFLDIVLKIVRKHYAKEIKINQDFLISLQNRYAEVRKEKTDLLDLLLRKVIKEEQYKDKSNALTEEEATLKAKLEDNSYNANKWLELMEGFFKQVNLLQKFWFEGNPQTKREIFKSVGWNPILSDKKLLMDYKNPYNILLEFRHFSLKQGR
ncbi:MAG: recombinase family protein [Patescibacteria group bacterium]|nr:recombinase family protein [Patescibacteria group bacterium]